ncbi:MAG: rhodanese-like domain-containing protein [Luteolibacter sp.]|uniref:rhodanese-like domain-containing protein n=1 Tax=Luteolibacter sp. TaxID=1962973 RepID=UPI003266957E
MTSTSFRLSALAMLIGTSSCAPSAHEAPAKPPVAAKETPAAPHKSVRMNGRGKITSISIPDFFTLQQSGKVLLYDARPAFFYHLGHIPGAISMPKSGCDAEIAKRESEIKASIASKTPIVVYCTNLLCPDARTVAIHLADNGYSSSTLTGGWESWKEAGLPTE